jgi:outer membrane protein TolC
MSIPLPAEPRPDPTPRLVEPLRLFHHARRHDIDEGSLQTWWRTLGDPVLDRLVEACLAQNAELSVAALRVAEACAGLPGSLEDLATHPDCLAAWTRAHCLRIRFVVGTVRAYIDVLALQERLLCVDTAIRHQGFLQRFGRASAGDRAGDGVRRTQWCNLHELHLFRERLQGERDVTAVGLAWLVGEPLDVVLGRIEGRLLPQAPSAIPASGTPDALMLRRPDLLSLALKVRQGVAADSTRIDAIRSEQAFDRAVCDVESALAVLASAIGEAGPARAAALAAGNRASALMQRVRAGELDVESLIEADRLYHGHCDREIEVRARGLRALAALYEAMGAGWPAPIEAGEAR